MMMLISVDWQPVKVFLCPVLRPVAHLNLNKTTMKEANLNVSMTKGDLAAHKLIEVGLNIAG